MALSLPLFLRLLYSAFYSLLFGSISTFIYDTKKLIAKIKIRVSSKFVKNNTKKLHVTEPTYVRPLDFVKAQKLGILHRDHKNFN